MAVISGEDIKQLPTKSFIETVFISYTNNANTLFLEDVPTGKKFTFGDLHQLTCKIGTTLIKLGIGPGHLVTIVSENSFESFAFIYGVILCGATVSPINPELKPDEVSKMLEVSRPSLIYSKDEKHLSMINDALKMTSITPRIMTAASFRTILVTDNEAKNFEPPKVNSAKHIYLVLFTSGTTGVPKAVKLRDQATLIQCEHIKWAYGKFLLTSPLFWISNSLLLAKCMVSGFTIVIPGCSDAERLLRIIQDYKVTSWFGGPAVLVEMCNIENLQDYDLSSTESVFTGGSHITLEHKHLIQNTLFKGRRVLRVIYGSTEAGVISEWPERMDPNSPEFESIGKPVPGCKIKIKDINSGKTLNSGEQGEICVNTINFMAGYMNKDLSNNPLDDEGYWHMGDIGYFDKNGYLYYVSRSKDIFKYRGVQIAPSELEAIILQHPSVLETAVVGKPHVIDGEWPTAFVVIKPNVKESEKEIEEFVAARVPDSKRLRGGVHFLDTLPKSAVGKVLPSKLLELLK